MTNEPRHLTVATAPTGGDEVVLALGPSHPSSHGLLRLRLELDGDTVVRADPIVGFLHRGAEKLFEVRDYRQGLALANRHDWLSAFSDELVMARVVERMLGLEVPDRAVWLRTLFAELGRVLAALPFLGAGPRAVSGEGTAARFTSEAAFRAREDLTTVMERATGGRLHFMVTAVGGLVADIPPGWLDEVTGALARVRADLRTMHAGLVDDPGFRRRTVGVGVVSADLVEAYGASGPVARGSGVPLDLRVDDPDLAYPELADLLVPLTRDGGDAAGRFDVLLAEAERSLDLVAACVEGVRSVGAGPVNVLLPKVLRVPEGEGYAWLEAPLGIAGVHLVSRGDKVPARVKLRTPSYAHVQLLGAVLAGTPFDDLVPTLTSFFFVVGDVDK